MPSLAFDHLVIDGARARGRLRPSHAAALCAGHFPGDPFVPGAYLAGLMADLAARLVRDGRRLVRVRRVVRCVFRAPVAPGGDIIVVARRRPARQVDVEVHAGGVCAARATLAFGPGA